MDLPRLCRTSAQNPHGHAVAQMSFAMCMVLIHQDISAIVVSKNKPIAFARVLYDIATICGVKGWEPGLTMAPIELQTQDLETVVAEMHLAVSLAYGSSCIDDPERGPSYFFGVCLTHILGYFQNNEWDLDQALKTMGVV